MTLKAYIGKHEVPVKNRFATLARFSGGEGGKHEAGDFAFWTAVLKEPVVCEPRDGWPKRKKTVRKIMGRAYIALSAGDRFHRMKEESKTAPVEDRPIYRRMFYEVMGAGANVKEVRASNPKEVRRWLDGHKSDAKFMEPKIWFKGKQVKP